MVSIRAVPLTATHDEPAAALLRGYVDAMNASIVDTWGNTDFIREPHELLGAMRDQEYERRVRLAAVDDDAGDEPTPAQVHGYGVLNMPLRDNTTWAYVEVGVRPGSRGRGVGGALYDELVLRARAGGRTTLMGESEHAAEPPAGPGALTAPTGSGRVPVDAPSVRFAQARGFVLEQVERHSRLGVPLNEAFVEQQRALAAQAAGDEYRTVGWSGDTPEEWVDAMAVLKTRMSAGVPLAGLEYEEDRWDAERVRAADRTIAARGLSRVVTTALHVPSGQLVGYTEFLTIPTSQEFVYQDDTLVLQEHRGHRLGMLVKAANLQRLAVERPRVRRIGTWNAEENDHMLAINIALGFRPAGCCGAWQLKL